MNAKRLIFLFLVIIGILGIAATIYFLFWKPAQPAVTPVVPTQVGDGLPQTQPTTPAQATTNTPNVPPPAPDSDQELERKAREALFRRSRDLTSRFATYSNADGFVAMTQVYDDVTLEVRAYLEQQKTQLNTDHPGRAEAYAQTTRALAARLGQEVIVRTATQVEVVVDVQQQIQQGDSTSTMVRQALLTLVRQADTWNISRIAWQDLAL